MGSMNAWGGRTSKQEQAIIGFFGNQNVVDARNSIRVIAMEKDKEGADRADPRSCVFARACQRQFGSTGALFFLSVAYVDIPDDRGVMRVERFRISEQTRRQIVEFDKGGDPRPGGYLLLPMPKSDSKESKHRSNKKYRRNRKALLHGKAVSQQRAKRQLAAQKALKTKAILRYDGVRNGTGMVHFTRRGPGPQPVVDVS
jgi:hypothetical protein